MSPDSPAERQHLLHVSPRIAPERRRLSAGRRIVVLAASLALATLGSWMGAAEARACDPGYSLCGVSHCSPDGSTCCASAGDETLSCPNGQYCIQSGSGITCGGGAVDPGTGCNEGVLRCGNNCINTCTPESCVCCPDGTGAPSADECAGSTSSSSCEIASPAQRPPAWLAVPFALGALGLLARRRRPTR